MLILVHLLEGRVGDHVIMTGIFSFMITNMSFTNFFSSLLSKYLEFQQKNVEDSEKFINEDMEKLIRGAKVR